MSWLDEMFGTLFDNGTELELLGGLNFIGFTITADPANNRHNIAVSGAATVASAVTNDSGVSGSSVKDALNTLNGAIATNTSNITTNTTNIATNTTSITTLNGRQIIAGTNLSGGGTLAADRTLSLVPALTGITSINGAALYAPTQGSNLTDADQTLTIGGGANYTMPASTTSATRNKTLGASGAALGDVISIAVYAQGNNVVIKDDAGTTLYTVTAGAKRIVDARYNGTHFADVCSKPLQ